PEPRRRDAGRGPGLARARTRDGRWRGGGSGDADRPRRLELLVGGVRGYGRPTGPRAAPAGRPPGAAARRVTGDGRRAARAGLGAERCGLVLPGLARRGAGSRGGTRGDPPADAPDGGEVDRAVGR